MDNRKKTEDLLEFRHLISESEELPAEPAEYTEGQELSSFRNIVPNEGLAEKAHIAKEIDGTESNERIDEADALSVGVTPSNAAKDIHQIHTDAISLLQRLVHNSGRELTDVLREGRYLVERLIPFVKVGESLYDKLNTSYSTENYIPNHCSNATLLTLEIAQGLDYEPKLLLDLGYCALFHDIGMMRVPQEIFLKSTQLSELEFSEVKKHPIYGSELIKQVDGDEALLYKVTLSEHEREDGSGYPFGLKGAEISETAKIIGLADVFEALSANRVYHPGLSQFHAIQEILRWGKKLFHPKLLKAFLHQFSLFPIKSYVSLNNRVVGRVVSTNTSYPTKPVIQILYDNKGSKVEDEQYIELHKEPLLYIVEVHREEDILSEDN